MTLPKQRRLKEPKIISRAFSDARPVQESGVSLRTVAGKNRLSRFVVVVPVAAVPLAVRRNIIRRRVAECIRNILAGSEILPGRDIVITVRSVPADGVALMRTLVLLMKKSGILQQ